MVTKVYPHLPPGKDLYHDHLAQNLLCWIENTVWDDKNLFYKTAEWLRFLEMSSSPAFTAIKNKL